MAEGTITTWGAIFLSEERGASHLVATLGYAMFTGMLSLGRLFGDRLERCLGTRVLVRLFAFGAAASLLMTLVGPWAIVGVFGIGLFGLGMSVLDPLLQSVVGHSASSEQATGEERETAQTSAIGHMATMGNIGLLAAPSLIGWLAELVGLTWALMVPVLLVCMVGANASRFATVGRRMALTSS
jgi:MFS family permease